MIYEYSQDDLLLIIFYTFAEMLPTFGYFEQSIYLHKYPEIAVIQTQVADREIM